MPPKSEMNADVVWAIHCFFIKIVKMVGEWRSASRLPFEVLQFIGLLQYESPDIGEHIRRREQRGGRLEGRRNGPGHVHDVNNSLPVERLAARRVRFPRRVVPGRLARRT